MTQAGVDAIWTTCVHLHSCANHSSACTLYSALLAVQAKLSCDGAADKWRTGCLVESSCSSQGANLGSNAHRWSACVAACLIPLPVTMQSLVSWAHCSEVVLLVVADGHAQTLAASEMSI